MKICDFGYSKHLRQDSLPKSKVGTPGYTGARRTSNAASCAAGASGPAAPVPLL